MATYRIFIRVKTKILGFFIAFLTPFYFSYKSGHFLSSIHTKAVDKNGHPIPWYTYPAIDFLARKDFTNRSVLEFGSGQSTLWWAKRARRLVSFDCSKYWYNRIGKRMPLSANIFYIPRDLTGIEPHIKDELFDLIIVDGLDRLKAAQKAPPLLKKNGAIIVDDTEGFLFPAAYREILDLFKRERFSRIDFYGYKPACFLPSCTSIFFKDNCFLLNGAENPA